MFPGTRFLFGLLICCCVLFGQSPAVICSGSSVAPVVRAEGITERVGDIVLQCSGGAPNAQITGNLSVFLNVNITNRVASNNVTGVILTADSGSGPQPVTALPYLAGPNNLVYNGLSFTLSSSGAATLRLAGERVAAVQVSAQQPQAIQAFLSFNSGDLVSLVNPSFPVATTLIGLYVNNSSRIICAPQGSPLPATITFSNLIAAGSTFASTRLTEGFAGAFAPRSATANLNADTGERFLITYSGFPAGVQLYVPNVIAGSDAVQPTAGGDLGITASGGQYAPTSRGSLLLALVPNASASGAGGLPIYTPGPTGSGTVTFDSVSAVPLTNGTGYAVYEVVDSNPNDEASAQFPTFLGLASSSVGSAVITNETVSFAPVSTVMTATAADPIPRFQAVTPPSDCGIIGDCGAPYFPNLWVNTNPISLTAPAGGNYQVAYTEVQNRGGGFLEWQASITYQNGSNWLTADPPSGLNNGTIRVDASPGNLAPGTYQATLTVSAGPVSGSQSVPITFVVTAPVPSNPVPAITSVVNSATLTTGPITPGSLATVFGTGFTGSNPSVMFGGNPAQVLFSNSTQLNVLVPAGLALGTTQVTVAVNGSTSQPFTVSLSGLTPAIFSGGIANQDGSANSPSNPASAGTVLVVYATGLSEASAITAQVQGQSASVEYGGPAPTIPGVQQVNLILPSNAQGTLTVSVCGVYASFMACSAPASVAVSAGP